jgi:hypothetical protein
MVEVVRPGAVRRTIYCRSVRQNTARIDRTFLNVAVCRAFLRAIATVVPLADEPLPTAVSSTDHISTFQESCDLQLFRSLSDSCGRCGRYSDQLYRWSVIALRISFCRTIHLWSARICFRILKADL